jgi:hypothetical protein
MTMEMTNNRRSKLSRDDKRHTAEEYGISVKCKKSSIGKKICNCCVVTCFDLPERAISGIYKSNLILDVYG